MNENGSAATVNERPCTETKVESQSKTPYDPSETARGAVDERRTGTEDPVGRVVTWCQTGGGAPTVDERNEPATTMEHPLTANQREILRQALERGYFEVPKRASLVEVSDALGRSDVETSQELRRGIGAALSETDVLDPPTHAEDGTETTLNRLFDALGHPYRRRVLLRLVRDAGDSDREDGTVDPPTGDRADEHLSALAAAGFVERDEERGAVRRGPDFEEIEPVLRVLDDHGDELPDGWPR